VLLDYDSTLNPGQGNAPLTDERVAILGPHFKRWRDAGVELYVLTASNPKNKVDALQAAGLLHFFTQIFSSTFPDSFGTKGDFLAMKLKKHGWNPVRQFMAEDSCEHVMSILQHSNSDSRSLAHTLRVQQHSKVGLTEEDLRYIDDLVDRDIDFSKTTHIYASTFDGEQFVDNQDSVPKCMLDTLGVAERAEVLRANPPERQIEWVDGRPDNAALVQKVT